MARTKKGQAVDSLGGRIRSAREAKGYLQSDLAGMIGVKSAGVISNWERDLNKPDADLLVKLCHVLGVSASYLLDYYGRSSFEVRPEEEPVLEKWRGLDETGLRVVRAVLDLEYERSVSAEKEEKELE